jgi:hypothetical protein
VPAGAARAGAELADAGLLVADPGVAAAAVERILAGDGTGQAWVAQAGQAAAPIELPQVAIATAAGEAAP